MVGFVWLVVQCGRNKGSEFLFVIENNNAEQTVIVKSTVGYSVSSRGSELKNCFYTGREGLFASIFCVFNKQNIPFCFVRKNIRTNITYSSPFI